MNSDWSEGYFTDISYTFGYYREISPAFLNFCLLLHGVMPPDAVSPNYCELGIGQGLSLNVHAATNPGSFWGTDFNPEHAAFAQGLSRAASLPLDIRDDSFQELLAADLPPMDYITLHGIWTWVSKENQAQIVKFARKLLRPGGVLYISYNCFPGWSAAAPLRQLFAMHDQYASRVGGATQRVQSAMDFAEKVLLGTDSSYARSFPGLQPKLDGIKSMDKRYVAHEYFNREWNVMYFSDVAAHLAEAKLELAGTANPLEMLDALNLSAEGQKTLQAIAHPVLREQVRDYLVGSQFRKDIFTRGARKLSLRERNQRLSNMRFILTSNPADVPKKVNGAYMEGELQAAIYDPLLAYLAEENYLPKTLESIEAHLSGFANGQQALQAVTTLVGMNYVMPCNDEGIAATQLGSSAKLNQQIITRALSVNACMNFLASPVTGSGVAVSRIVQLFIIAHNSGHADPVAFVAGIYKENNERLVKDGKVLEDMDSTTAEIKILYKAYCNNVLPIISALKVI